MNDTDYTHDGPVTTTEQIANMGGGTQSRFGSPAETIVPDDEPDLDETTVPGDEPVLAETTVPDDEPERPSLARLDDAPGDDRETAGQPHAQLLADPELESIREQWKEIQFAFVDEPRKAVQDADALVAELMQRLAQKFASERKDLESRWAGGDEVSTEDLRRGLRRYRSFFERLLAA